MFEKNIFLKKLTKSDDGFTVFLEFECSFFDFEEGQFVMLEYDVLNDGNPIKRAYSIATTNEYLKEKGIIGFIIKKVSEKGMSDFLTQKIKIGDEIKLTGPLGAMNDKKCSKKYLFISNGTGIAPIFSIYTKLKKTGNYEKISTIFGERYKGNILSNIKILFSENNENVKNVITLSKEESEKWFTKGHVQDFLQESLSFLGTKNIQVILCGSPNMIKDVEEKLLKYGIEKNCITFEMY